MLKTALWAARPEHREDAILCKIIVDATYAQWNGISLEVQSDGTEVNSSFPRALPSASLQAKLQPKKTRNETLTM